MLRCCLALRHSWGWRAIPAAWWVYVPAGGAKELDAAHPQKTFLRVKNATCVNPKFTLAAVAGVQP